MKPVSPVVRISFSLMLCTASIVLIIGFLGYFPDHEKITIAERVKAAEMLAEEVSMLVSNSQVRLAEQSVNNFAKRYQDATAILMKSKSGLVYAESGDTDHLKTEIDDSSSFNYLEVPIFYHERRWGGVYVEFKSPYAKGWLNGFIWFIQTVYGFTLFLALACFAGYFLIIRRTLRILDPQKVIPERIKSAFNTLTEGLVILDDKYQILLANDAFTKLAGLEAGSMLGLDISGLNWSLRKEDEDIYPWVVAMESGLTKTSVAMHLHNKGSNRLSLSVNASPIQDDNKVVRGAMITVENISELEQKNLLLTKLVDRLSKTEQEILEKNRSLVELATRDPLTGCFNRRAFFEKFDELFSQNKKTADGLACLMIDIDFFKSINDNHGHGVGDDAIKFIANTLITSVRDEDLVGRYGGEEFCVVLAGITPDDARKQGERIRTSIQEMSPKELPVVGVMTASIGVSFMTTESVSPSQLLDFADKALYKAKEAGRNRVICWQEEEPSNLDTTQTE